MAKLLNGEIRSLPHISILCTSKGPKHGDDPTSLGCGEVLSAAWGARITTRRKRVATRRYVSDDDYDDKDYMPDTRGEDYVPDTHSFGIRVKPTGAMTQTQRMLVETGSSGYWGAVYSVTGERIGTSYVTNTLQNVTIQTAGLSPTLDLELPTFQRRQAYVGKWQKTWGPCPTASDYSHKEGATAVDNHAGSDGIFDHTQTYYVATRASSKPGEMCIQSQPHLLLCLTSFHPATSSRPTMLMFSSFLLTRMTCTSSLPTGPRSRLFHPTRPMFLAPLPATLTILSFHLMRLRPSPSLPTTLVVVFTIHFLLTSTRITTPMR